MKVDKKVIELLIEEISILKQRTNDFYTKYVKDLEEAETVEKAMELKKSLLLSVVAHIPLFGLHCYFCEIYSSNCNRCPYARFHHGICDEPGSDFDIIKNFKKDLSLEITNRYYKGEVYEEKEIVSKEDLRNKEREEKEINKQSD